MLQMTLQENLAVILKSSKAVVMVENLYKFTHICACHYFSVFSQVPYIKLPVFTAEVTPKGKVF